jgi:hypothetical protein
MYFHALPFLLPFEPLEDMYLQEYLSRDRYIFYKCTSMHYPLLEVMYFKLIPLGQLISNVWIRLYHILHNFGLRALEKQMYRGKVFGKLFLASTVPLDQF